MYRVTQWFRLHPENSTNQHFQIHLFALVQHVPTTFPKIKFSKVHVSPNVYVYYSYVYSSLILKLHAYESTSLDLNISQLAFQCSKNACKSQTTQHARQRNRTNTCDRQQNIHTDTPVLKNRFTVYFVG
jgi:hypothetical protein